MSLLAAVNTMSRIVLLPQGMGHCTCYKCTRLHYLGTAHAVFTKAPYPIDVPGAEHLAAPSKAHNHHVVTDAYHPDGVITVSTLFLLTGHNTMMLLRGHNTRLPSPSLRMAPRDA